MQFSPVRNESPYVKRSNVREGKKDTYQTQAVSFARIDGFA